MGFVWSLGLLLRGDSSSLFEPDLLLERDPAAVSLVLPPVEPERLLEVVGVGSSDLVGGLAVELHENIVTIDVLV